MSKAGGYAEYVQNISEWDRVLTEQPDMLIDIFADVAKIVQASKTGRVTGRRPTAQAVSMDELWETLFPERFSTAPISESLPPLIGDLSLGQFALKVGCARSLISQILTGKRSATPQTMTAMARAAGVTPAYFAEWRAWRLSELLADAFLANPELTAQIAKRLSKGAGRGRPA